MAASIRLCSVFNGRVLWRQASILVRGFVLVFCRDSDSVWTELSPPAVTKKDIPQFCLWLPLSYWPLLMISLSMMLGLQHNAPPTPGFIKVWQPCQYSPSKVGRKPSSPSMRWTNVFINLNIAEELSALYVKLCVPMWELCTKSAQAICAHGMSYTIKLLTHVWHFHQYT